MKKTLAILLAALLVFALVGCGSTTNNTTGGTSAVDRIKASGKLVVMTNATFPPYEYVKDGAPTGVDIELAQMIADKLGVELEVLDMNFDLLIAALQNGKGDLVAAGMSITEERQKEVDFSVPYVDSTLLIIVPEGSSITGPNDLSGKSIAVQENTTSDLYVTGEVDAKEVSRFKSAVDAGNALRNGKVDAVVMDEMTAKNIVDNSNGELILLDDPLTHEQYAMAIAKGQEDFLEVVNEVLSAAVKDGTVTDLIEKHMVLSQEG